MSFNNHPNYDFKPDPEFAAAYRRLYDSIQPSEQLLAATRRLYAQPGPAVNRSRYFWPAAAASLCAACLLLAFSVQLWPQPDELTALNTNTMKMRSAAQQSEQEAAIAGGADAAATKDRMAELPEQYPENAWQSRMAERTAPENPKTDVTAEQDGPEMCSLPLYEYDCLKLSDSAPSIEIIKIQHLANFILKTLNWLVLW